jgi:serine/threonine-protein kinase
MGKTSLMGRILNHGKENDCLAIPLTFQRASSKVFNDLDSLLRWFCEQVGRKLNQLHRLEEYWNGAGSKNDACYFYFEECLLEELDSPLVLGLDEFDRVLSEPHLANDFCGLLRAWNEASRSGDFSSEKWQKLRLAIVHSTEIYGALDIKQSPICNVGKTVDLPEFNEEQIQELAALYGLGGSAVTALQEMVGGHPYLLRKAFYELRRPNASLEPLLAGAPTDAGIYSDHLRRHLLNLQRNSSLAEALRQVVKQSPPKQIDPILAFQLESMGLIECRENQVVPRCELYRQYFLKQLR